MIRRTRWIVIGLVVFTIVAGCIQPAPGSGTEGPTPTKTGLNTPDEIPGTPESGPARLGDIQLRNQNNISATVVIRVVQNNTTIYQTSRRVPANTAAENGPIYLDAPNVSGTFVVETRLKEQSKWHQVRSTRGGLRNGGCFVVSIIIRQDGQLDVFPAGKSCEGPP